MGEADLLSERTRDLDQHIGRQLRSARAYAGWSQTDLANVLGISFQQVQKYEKGSNRIGAGTLYLIARALDVPLTHFFEGLDQPDDIKALPPRRVLTTAGRIDKIRDPHVQTAILTLVHRLTLAEAEA